MHQTLHHQIRCSPWALLQWPQTGSMQGPFLLWDSLSRYPMHCVCLQDTQGSYINIPKWFPHTDVSCVLKQNPDLLRAGTRSLVRIETVSDSPEWGAALLGEGSLQLGQRAGQNDCPRAVSWESWEHLVTWRPELCILGGQFPSLLVFRGTEVRESRLMTFTYRCCARLINEASSSLWDRIAEETRLLLQVAACFLQIVSVEQAGFWVWLSRDSIRSRLCSGAGDLLGLKSHLQDSKTEMEIQMLPP